MCIKWFIEKRRSFDSMEKKTNELQRVILFPLPLQGCINPTLQLAKILHSKGFSITVIHTRFNAPPSSSHHSLFTFLQISDGLSETEASTSDVALLLSLLNRNCESPFRECLANLLSSGDETEKGRISCLIDDHAWLFTQAVAESFNLPRLVLNTYKATFFLRHLFLPQLRRKGYYPVKDSEAEDPVPEFPPLKKKDLSGIMWGDTELLDPSLLKMLETTKASSGLVLMSCEELEQDCLSQCREIFRVPIFAIGPFHSYFPRSSSSLLAPDETCIPWLDRQEDKSVIYVSLGSIATISEAEFLEIAWGLSSCDQPFLWVVRPGSIRDEPWIEHFPQGFVKNLEERGKIVKWAPQIDVLAHRATGGFLTHCGWNSTLESICAGVPMICVPRVWDQMLNGRFISDVWRVGVHLEGRIERGEIERVVRRVMAEPEGEEIRKKMIMLKEQVGRSIEEGGSSYQSLENLVHHISSF